MITKTNNTKSVLKITSAFKILSDPTRFKILCSLVKNKKGLCVYELADMVNISHSAASHQLSKLEAHGVVDSFKEGQNVCYSLKDNTLVQNLIRVMKIFHC